MMTRLALSIPVATGVGRARRDAAFALATLGLVVGLSHAVAAELRPDQVRFREVFKELVETNTTLSSGSCTLAAERMAARLASAGFSASELTLFAAPEHPKEGGLVAVLPGTSRSAKSMLLLGHLDVVEARREDWARDPFTLIEENGRFYARGVMDMKAMDAVWVDMLMRFREEGFRPKRTVKLALTCGEETARAFNGAEWLAKNRRELIAAEFALNEGGGGRTDENGKLVTQGIQVGEKVVQQFRLETTNPGGHSSAPVRDNAIYQLADALGRIRDHEFPSELNDTTRAFFAKGGARRDDELGRAMVAFANDPSDRAAEAVLNRDRSYHSVLRTTCVATLLEGGHADNALPQRAGANINCRMFPGRTMEETKSALETAIGDPGVRLIPLPPIRSAPTPPPLDPRIITVAERVAAKHFPGVSVVPMMATAASDAIFLTPAGIPTYGVPGFWTGPEGAGGHGLNENIEARALYAGRDYLTDLVKAYASAP